MRHVGTKQAVLNLIRVIENSVEIGFNMESLIDSNTKGDFFKDRGRHNCKTTCCFSGFAVYGLNKNGTYREVLSKRKTFLQRIRTSFSARYRSISIYGMESLALTDWQADRLFEPQNVDLESITLRQGIRVLKNFARTGEIDWKKYLRKNQLYDPNLEL